MTTIRDGYDLLNDPLLNKGTAFSDCERDTFAVPLLLGDGAPVRVDQTNNSYVFPGIGLAAVATGARRISDGMLMAAARTLAEISPARRDPRANLLPPVTDLREVSWRVARSVAVQAWNEGLTALGDAAAVSGAIQSKMWMPAYRELVPAHG
jgi:malate dehydrogenase (oxaloacetate-decarboxylating)